MDWSLSKTQKPSPSIYPCLSSRCTKNRFMQNGLCALAPLDTSQKHQTADEVLLAIRRVLAGEIYLSPMMTAKLLKTLTGTEASNIARSVDDLTDRELQVLALIGRGYTTHQIADTLQLGAATVDTYRARIKEKLGFRNATELQHFAVRWARERE